MDDDFPAVTAGESTVVCAVFNWTVYCGSCRRWYTSEDDDRPHDVGACYREIHGDNPDPHGFLTADPDPDFTVRPAQEA